MHYATCFWEIQKSLCILKMVHLLCGNQVHFHNNISRCVFWRVKNESLYLLLRIFRLNNKIIIKKSHMISIWTYLKMNTKLPKKLLQHSFLFKQFYKTWERIRKQEVWQNKEIKIFKIFRCKNFGAVLSLKSNSLMTVLTAIISPRYL